MSNYRRSNTHGGTYFFTIVAFKRRKILCEAPLLQAMREAVQAVQQTMPFTINAWVTLPDHVHAIWTLPPDDCQYGKRWGLIKRHISTRHPEYWAPLEMLTASNIKRDEKGIWQRRFWAHEIFDDDDYAKHMDYTHFNPVGHELVNRVVDWKYSTFHKYCKEGLYESNWSSEVVDGEFGELV
jgi:putative transposase